MHDCEISSSMYLPGPSHVTPPLPCAALSGYDSGSEWRIEVNQLAEPGGPATWQNPNSFRRSGGAMRGQAWRHAVTEGPCFSRAPKRQSQGEDVKLDSFDSVTDRVIC